MEPSEATGEATRQWLRGSPFKFKFQVQIFVGQCTSGEAGPRTGTGQGSCKPERPHQRA